MPDNVSPKNTITLNTDNVVSRSYYSKINLRSYSFDNSLLM